MEHQGLQSLNHIHRPVQSDYQFQILSQALSDSIELISLLTSPESLTNGVAPSFFASLAAPIPLLTAPMTDIFLSFISLSDLK
jgi:hypothetical protein